MGAGKKRAAAAAAAASSGAEGATPAAAKRAKGDGDEAEAAAAVPRAALPRKALPAESGGVRLLSWNAAGLRAVKDKALAELRALVASEAPDVLVVQETKLQDQHVKELVGLLPGYSAHFSCSQDKKGYAGTAAFVRDASFANGSYEASFGIGAREHDQEGRSITLKLPRFNLVALYVPNSGQKLERLDYRTSEWDGALWAYVERLSKETGKPSVVGGDLNVAHRDVDLYNPTAPHIKKTPGCTAQERASFSACLEKNGFVDSFRHLYPSAAGCFSYWSTRAGNRPGNKGLRLDYWLVPGALAAGKGALQLHDSYILHDQLVLPEGKWASDHCPVGLELRGAK